MKSMFKLRPFLLEDFFHEYEHRPGLLNLASSDANPWTLNEMIELCPRLQDDLAQIVLKYPDVDRILLPSLNKFCKPPEGMGVLAVSGAAEAIFLVLAEHISNHNGRSRVAVPLLGYGAFAGISHLLGCDIEEYKYDPDADWLVNVDALRTASKQCNVVVVNNPHNPTGHLIDPELLKEIGDEVSKNGGTLLVDEIFRFPEDCESATSLGHHVTVIGSLSKIYGMPGLRLGWIIADKARLDRLLTLQQYTTLSSNVFAVRLGATVIDHINSSSNSSSKSFSRRDLLVRNRQTIQCWSAKNADLLRVVDPQAGTTAVLEIKTSRNEEELFDAFLKANVLLVPGSRCFEFKGPRPWFRLGYGASEDVLHQGLEAVAKVVHGYLH